MPIAVFSPRADKLLREQEKEHEWQVGFEAMGSDPEVSDVEYMISAAREVIFGHENEITLDDLGGVRPERSGLGAGAGFSC